MPIPLGLKPSLHTASAVPEGSAGGFVPEERGHDPHFWSPGSGSGRVSTAVQEGIQEYHHQTLR